MISSQPSKAVYPLITPSGEPQKNRTGIIYDIIIDDKIHTSSGVNTVSLDSLFAPYSFYNTGMPLYANTLEALQLSPLRGAISFIGGSGEGDIAKAAVTTGNYSPVGLRVPFSFDQNRYRLGLGRRKFQSYNRENNQLPQYWLANKGMWGNNSAGLDNKVGNRTYTLYYGGNNGSTIILPPPIFGYEPSNPFYANYRKSGVYGIVNSISHQCDCNASYLSEVTTVFSGLSPSNSGNMYENSGCTLGLDFPTEFVFSGTAVIPVSGYMDVFTSTRTQWTGIALSPVSKEVTLVYNNNCQWVSDIVYFSGYETTTLIQGGVRTTVPKYFLPCPSGAYVGMQATMNLYSRLVGGAQYYLAALVWEKVEEVMPFNLSTGVGANIPYPLSGYQPIISETYINLLPFNPFRNNKMTLYTAPESDNSFFGVDSIKANFVYNNVTFPFGYVFTGYTTELSRGSTSICLRPK